MASREKHEPAGKRERSPRDNAHELVIRKEWLAYAAFLAVGLVAGAFFSGAVFQKAGGGGQTLSLQEASQKAVRLINQNILASQGVSATLADASERSGLYFITLDIKQNGQTVQSADAYLSRDGELLFTQPLNLSDVQADQSGNQQTAPPPKSDNPDVKLFVMSFCPYGQQALKTMAPVVNALGTAVKVEPHYVIYDNICADGSCSPSDYCIANGTLCSMHGVNEVREDVRQLCVWKYAQDKYWPYVLYVSDNCLLSNVESCWKNAASATGVDQARISECASKESGSLIQAEYELDQQYGVAGSPTLLINGAEYSGATSQALLNGICSAFNSPPSSCSATLSSTAPAAPAGGCGG